MCQYSVKGRKSFQVLPATYLAINVANKTGIKTAHKRACSCRACLCLELENDIIWCQSFLIICSFSKQKAPWNSGHKGVCYMVIDQTDSLTLCQSFFCFVFFNQIDGDFWLVTVLNSVQL